MPLKDMATSTGAYVLVRQVSRYRNPDRTLICSRILRTLGGTIGISLGGAIYASELRRKLPTIPGYSPSASYQDTSNLAGLVHIQVNIPQFHPAMELLIAHPVVASSLKGSSFTCLYTKHFYHMVCRYLAITRADLTISQDRIYADCWRRFYLQ